MKFIQFVRSFFTKKTQAQLEIAADTYRHFNLEEYIARHLSDIEKELPGMIVQFGDDFNAFFYQRGIDKILRKELIFFRDPNCSYGDFLDHDYWEVKRPYNFPGPFYTGESDTCGTGDVEAPGNVMYDENTCEYVFRQPQNYMELLCVMDAAAVEVWDSYSCNGNKYWTYEKCKEWWKNRYSLIADLNGEEFRRTNGDRVALYLDYLNTSAENDLRKYCYFLENGVYPDNIKLLLPEL